MNAISNQLPGHSFLTIISILYSLTVELKDYTADMLSEFMDVVMGREDTPLSKLVKRIVFFKFLKS